MSGKTALPFGGQAQAGAEQEEYELGKKMRRSENGLSAASAVKREEIWQAAIQGRAGDLLSYAKLGVDLHESLLGQHVRLIGLHTVARTCVKGACT